MHRTAKQIHNHLKSANNLALVSHQNPDGDTLGSAVAMAEYLQTLGKEVRIFCLSPVPDKFDFLRHIGLVSQDEKIFAQADTIAVLDSGDLKYAGVAEIIKDTAATIINIDHHATNANYGHINMVVPTASSTTEVVYNFFKTNNIHTTPSMACALLTGLITDTDNFSNSATTYTSLTAAGELLRLGANWTLINNQLVRNKSISTLKLWGVVLSRLNKKSPSGGSPAGGEEIDMAYTYLTTADIAEHDASEADVEGIANFLNKLDGAKISLFLKEMPAGKIKGSFRTTHEDMDVSALAKKLGGGGHKKAAGFTADGSITDIVNKITSMIK